MKEKLKNAFDRMTADADPGKVQAAVLAETGRETQESRRTPVKKILRTAAVCAAVLVLSVTVYAAAAKYLSVTVPENGAYDYLVKVSDASGGTARVDKKALEELEALAITQKDIEAGNWVSRTFETWTEAADWLDCGLLVSDLLTGDDTEWGRVTLTAYADSEGKLATLSLTGGCRIAGTEERCTVVANIPLDSWGEFDLTVGFGEDTHSGRTTETVEYTTPDGIPAEIVDVASLSLDEKGTTIRIYDTTMYIFHEGILYQIYMGQNPESQAELAKAIADSMK